MEDVVVMIEEWEVQSTTQHDRRKTIQRRLAQSQIPKVDHVGVFSYIPMVTLAFWGGEMRLGYLARKTADGRNVALKRKDT
jgi:hypothetical protein